MSKPNAKGLRADPASPAMVARHPKLTLLAVILTAVATMWLVRGSSSNFEALSLTPVMAAVLADGGAPAVCSGRPDITIVVFTDYQCGVCKATDPALQRLIARDPKVRVVFKDWPIFGAQSEYAARAALAAHRQGKYLGLHTALMSSSVRLDPTMVKRIAIRAGVDWPRAVADMKTYSVDVDRQLSQHAMQAWSLGLGGTPGYLIGPYLVRGGLDDRALARAVRRARDKPAFAQVSFEEDRYSDVSIARPRRLLDSATVGGLCSRQRS